MNDITKANFSKPSTGLGLLAHQGQLSSAQEPEHEATTGNVKGKLTSKFNLLPIHSTQLVYCTCTNFSTEFFYLIDKVKVVP